ncbi:MAG: PQQ-like beta-propeller repeat protein [Bacteroidales bacterium]|nr:PQQ-like beta-propeller repeat protein [Bacteroidales bacterium]
MKLKLSDKDISLLKVISQISGIFTLIVALTMIFSLIHLRTINPLDNPALLSVKEQFDKDQANIAKAEQVRAMDLMARKAYFATRSQVETGSYLLLAGAVIFLLCQRLIADNEKIIPSFAEKKHDKAELQKKSRTYLIIAGGLITTAAIVSSFMLRTGLPDISGNRGEASSEGRSRDVKVKEPDKSNWPFFRGQDSRGHAGGSGYPTEWNGAEGKNILWKTEIPRNGQSSPIVWENKIFITGAEGSTCEVYCFDKDNGHLLWTGSATGIEGEPTQEPETDHDTGLAASTAATNGKVVCAVFANGNLVCFDLDGNLKWSRNLGLPANVYGFSQSLIMYEDILIVQFDSDSKVSLLGIEAESGTQKWETLRRGRPVWSSPVLGYFGGRAQVIVNGNPEVTAYDPLTGEEIWTVEALSGDVAPSLAQNSKMVYAVTDYARLAAIKAGTGASIIWEDNYFTPDVSSPVANEEILIVATGTGDVACYNAEKGDTLWTHYFEDQYYASPIIADDMVYILNRSGVMNIVKASDKLEIIGEAPIGEDADCTPAFTDKLFIIRVNKNLYCIGEK